MVAGSQEEKCVLKYVMQTQGLGGLFLFSNHSTSNKAAMPGPRKRDKLKDVVTLNGLKISAKVY
jgi:hypothetical protein